jgi:hypothetical protein
LSAVGLAGWSTAEEDACKNTLTFQSHMSKSASCACADHQTAVPKQRRAYWQSVQNGLTQQRVDTTAGICKQLSHSIHRQEIQRHQPASRVVHAGSET